MFSKGRFNTPNRVLAGTACALLLCGTQVVRAELRRADDVKASDAKTISIATSPKVGDTAQYKTMLLLDLGGNEITIEQTSKHVVKEIKENKDYVLALEDQGGKMIAGGNDTAIPAGSPTTVTLNKVNRILAYKPEKEDNPYLSPSTQHLIALSGRIILPEKSVKPGDTWTTEIDNPQVKGKKVTIKTTYVGEEKADGVAARKLKQTLEADTDNADRKMTAEMTALLDATTGQLIEAEQTVKGVPGTMGPVDWKGTIKRLKPDAGKAEKN